MDAADDAVAHTGQAVTMRSRGSTSSPPPNSDGWAAARLGGMSARLPRPTLPSAAIELWLTPTGCLPAGSRQRRHDAAVRAAQAAIAALFYAKLNAWHDRRV